MQHNMEEASSIPQTGPAFAEAIEKKSSSSPMSVAPRAPSVFPMGIQYQEEKEKDSPFSAVGVLPRPLPPALRDSDEICIFSQERLADCDQLGAIVFSKTKKGSLHWQFLCNKNASFSDNSPKGVHLFDVDYLKDWVKRKGTKYIQCPLCKEGAETAKKVDEHEIDSLDQLVERRAHAKKQNDLPLQYFVEQLILAKVSSTKWDDTSRAQKQEETLRDVLRHWDQRNQIEAFFPKIQDALKSAVENNIKGLLRVLLVAIKDHPQAKAFTTTLLTLAAEKNAFDCAKMMCEEFSNLIAFELRPLALLAAIKQMNIGLVELLIEVMAKRNQRFIGDDCFTETIKKDMVDVARHIIIQRWHKPGDKDFELCKKLDGNMWTYLQSRRKATQNIADPMMDENMLTLDDDDWDDAEGSDEPLGDDDDW